MVSGGGEGGLREGGGVSLCHSDSIPLGRHVKDATGIFCAAQKGSHFDTRCLVLSVSHICMLVSLD